jgi:hypothetical protein
MTPAQERRVLRRLARLDRKRTRRAARTPHRFEEAHDDPAPAPICWSCLKPRDARVHIR